MKKLHPQECRILNIALLSNKQPFTLNAVEIQAMVNEGYVYQPMKLTVEILELLGFKNDTCNNMYLPLPTGYAVELCIEFDMGSTCLVRYWNEKQKAKYPEDPNPYDFVYIKHLEQVHSLQNLFYFLSGVELDTYNLLSHYNK